MARRSVLPGIVPLLLRAPFTQREECLEKAQEVDRRARDGA